MRILKDKFYKYRTETLQRVCDFINSTMKDTVLMSQLVY
jgi:hypothetical protein